MTGITIDWDFFVPEDPQWDIQHAESLMYLQMLWEARCGLVDLIKLHESAHTFWDWLLDLLELHDASMTVSDSHAWVFRDPYLLHADRIVLFDQHHDCWPREKDDAEQDLIRCHTWARAWLEANKDRELIWVYPDWQDPNDYEMQDDIRPRVILTPQSLVTQETFGDDISGIHICRSGCWTPPWLDHDFIKFVEEPGFWVDVTQDGDWDPMKPRWENVEEKKQQLRAMDQQFRQQAELLNEIKRTKQKGAGDDSQARQAVPRPRRDRQHSRRNLRSRTPTRRDRA